ncbi:hypothetical protein Hanom_Chr03g00258631 [Helianthus anomalus]
MFNSSIEACRRNIKFNGAVASAKVDFDPHSSPSMLFLDSAVQSMAGFLCALQYIWQFYLEAMTNSAIQISCKSVQCVGWDSCPLQPIGEY